MFTQRLAMALLTMAPLCGSAYETGNLTCESIGQLAGQTLSAKQSGIPQEIYLSLLNERLPGDAQIERRLVASITTIIYQNNLPAGVQPDDVYAAFRQDCLRALAEDGAKQDDDNSGADTDGGDQDATVGELRA